MSTIVQDLNTLQDARDDMKTALENKGMTVTNDIRTYANAIANIPSGSGSGDVKLFDTVEHMQADPNPSLGDLAVVYRNEIQPVTEESEFDSCTFPNEVVLDEAFTGDIYGSFRAVDSSSGYFDGMVEMSSSSFRFDGYGDNGEIRVEYESTDGVTYTRTDGGDALKEFGVIVKWEDYGEGFNSVIGNFMKIGGNYFEGLYKYVSKSDDNYILSFTDIINTGSDISTTVENINISDIIGIIRQIISENALYQMTVTCVITNGTVVLYTLGSSSGGTAHQYVYAPDIAVDENQGYVLHSNIAGGIRDGISKITVNLEQQTYVVTTLTHSTSIFDREYGDTFDLSSTVFFVGIDTNNQIFYPNIYGYFGSNLRKTLSTPIGNITEYYINNTQLDAIPEYVYEKTFYGKNGVETGLLLKNISNKFDDKTAEIYSKIIEQYDNMDSIKITDTTWNVLSPNMKLIPVKSNGIPLIDTSEVTTFTNFSQYAQNLKHIPTLNMSNALNCFAMFSTCNNIISVSNLDCSKVQNVANMFWKCANLRDVPYMDLSNVTSSVAMFRDCYNLRNVPNYNLCNSLYTGEMFTGCYNLTQVPDFNITKSTSTHRMFIYCYNLISAPNLDLRNVTSCNLMFYDCKSLVDVPFYNIRNAGLVSSMFYNCNNLSNNSLNNIMAMCTTITNTNVTNKTLKNIGLSQNQTNICKTLSNYSAFTSAGWTTGY